MKNILIEREKVEISHEEKVKDLIKSSSDKNGVVIKISNRLYRLKNEDGKLFTESIYPIFEFDDDFEFEKILKTII